MIAKTFKFFSYFTFFLTLWTIWKDISDINSPIIITGHFWSSFSLQTLLIFEALVSRYLDPCSFIRALECSPFLWHPLIASLLKLPLAIILMSITIILYFCGKKLEANKKTKTHFN